MRCPDEPKGIRFKRSPDRNSDNWIVSVDRDHCIGGQAPGSGGLYIMIAPATVAPATVEHLITPDIVGEPSWV